jgi:murein DD-endopeptidase MepM/ murein hydrolase activator NlpD
MRYGKKAAKFVNMHFALITIAFFILSLNAVSAPLATDTVLADNLIEYEPTFLAESSQHINEYLPVLSSLDKKQVYDQVLSTVTGPDTNYVPKPMLAETIPYEEADRLVRGLRREAITHTVENGETLSKIASHYGINVGTLVEDNSLDVSQINNIKPGTQLTIAPETKTDSVAWLDQLNAEQQRAREEAAKEEAARKSKLAQATKGKLSLSQVRAADTPVSGGSVNYGRPIGNGCRNGYHSYAVDCPAPMGTTITAAAGGVVTVTANGGWNGGYGEYVRIQHPNGSSTLYAHMSQVLVSPGESVSAGEAIGRVGMSGRTTGPHVHYEIIIGGQRMNPCRGYLSCS